MWKSLPTDYCTRLISWLCNDFVTLTTIIDFQGVRKDWNCPPIPEKKSEKTQNLSFSVWLLTRLFFLPSTDHKTLFCWSVPLGLPQASFLQNWREEKKFRVAEIRLQKPKNDSSSPLINRRQYFLHFFAPGWTYLSLSSKNYYILCDHVLYHYYH